MYPLFRSMKAKLFLLVTLTLALAAPALAHHGWSIYREDFDANMTIERVVFGFPHDRIQAVDEEGNRWNLLLAPPDRNEDFGYGAELFTVGDVVEFIGQRNASRHEGKVHFVNDLDGNNIYTYFYGAGTTSWDKENRR